MSYSDLYAGSMNLASTTFIGGVSWGLMTYLYAVCMYSLWRNFRSSGEASRKTILLAGWITIMWILSSFSTIANAYCAIYAYTWQKNYPGGPLAYMANEWNQPVPLLAAWTYSVTIWFADGLVLWRLAVFYHEAHPYARGLVLSIACLIYIGVIGTWCFGLMLASENQTLYSTIGMKAVIPAVVLSMTLSVFMTALISIRLLLFKRWMRGTLGHEETETPPCTSLVAMFIESAVLYATWSVVSIVVYAMDNPWQYVMFVTLCNVQVICPVLIVYRISKGLGWGHTTPSLTPMAFAEAQIASDSMLETQDTPEGQEEDKIPGIVFTRPTQRGQDLGRCKFHGQLSSGAERVDEYP